MRGHAKGLFELLTVACILAATSNTADAGLLQSWPVQIDKINRVAQGSLGSARNITSDSTQYIGCWNVIQGYNSTTSQLTRSGGCYAVNSAGTSASCAFPAIPMPPPGESARDMPYSPMSSDALIIFSWDSQGVCTGLQVWQFASLSPKQ